jgi:hypothetical protein
MYTRTFSFDNDPFKFAPNYSIRNYSNFEVQISNLRLEKSQLRVDITYSGNHTTYVDQQFLSCGSNTTPEIGVDIAKLIKNPVKFLKQFDSSEIPVTNLIFTFKIYEPYVYSPKKVKDFYEKNLNAFALNSFWSEIEKELNVRKGNNQKPGTQLKQQILESVVKKIDLVKEKLHAVALISPFLMMYLTVFLTEIITAVSTGMILLGCFIAMISIPIIGTCIISAKYNKEEVEAIKAAGALANENIDTPENKENLLTKLEKFFPVDESMAGFARKAVDIAIEIAHKSNLSYFEQFKNFFKSNAYHQGYYIGQELAAQKALSMKAYKPAN